MILINCLPSAAASRPAVSGQTPTGVWSGSGWRDLNSNEEFRSPAGSMMSLWDGREQTLVGGGDNRLLLAFLQMGRRRFGG